MPPEPAIGRLVGHVTGSAPGGWIERLALEPATQVDPRAVHCRRTGGDAARKNPLPAFGSPGGVRDDEAGGGARRPRPPQETQGGGALPAPPQSGGGGVWWHR